MKLSGKDGKGILQLYIREPEDAGIDGEEWTVEDRDAAHFGDAWVQTNLTPDESRAVASFLEDYRRRRNKKDEVSDKFCRELWSEMENIPFDEDSGGEPVLGRNFYTWEKGTPRKTIWRWFDSHYSRGVASLLYTQGE